MATGLVSWSRTAASNGNADSGVNMAEGQAPSTLNDGGRGIMASAAMFRDDISGAIATGGTSTAYTVTSYQGFASLSALNGQMIAFTPHTTNGATVTLSVDGLTAKPLRSAPSVELPSGVLVQGTPYVALYNNSDAVFYLHGFYVNPYQIPIAGSLDYWGTTAPNSAFALMYGQAISRTTYAALFSLLSTTFGVGDSSTTFNIPDLRGRVVAGKDDMGGSSANRLTNADDGLNGDTLGATADHETQSLVTANHAAYTPTVSAASVTTVFQNISAPAVGVTKMALASASGDGATNAGNTVSITLNAQGGTSQAFGIIQPTIIGNKILRLI